MELSIVVPLYNERDNLGSAARGTRASGRRGRRVVRDAVRRRRQTDGSVDVLRTIKAGDPHVRVLRLARNSGQTAALACGLHEAAGDIVVAIDGDGENDPADIPRLLAKLDRGLRPGERMAHRAMGGMRGLAGGCRRSPPTG